MPSDEESKLVEIAPGLKVDPREMTFSEICRRLGRERAAAPKKPRKKAPRRVS
jgi:hypothetical protein